MLIPPIEEDEDNPGENGRNHNFPPSSIFSHFQNRFSCMKQRLRTRLRRSAWFIILRIYWR
jgi:hypothetical protein